MIFFAIANRGGKKNAKKYSSRLRSSKLHTYDATHPDCSHRIKSTEREKRADILEVENRNCQLRPRGIFTQNPEGDLKARLYHDHTAHESTTKGAA